LPTLGWAGQGQLSCISGMKNCGTRKSDGGQKFLPPFPLPFCPPERKISKIPHRDFLGKKSGFYQEDTAHKYNFRF